MKTTPLLIGTALLVNFSVPLNVQAQTGHDSCAGHACAPSSAKKLALNGAAQIVFENYLRVQAALAQDSLEKVSASAQLLAQAARTDAAKSFPASVAVQADALAKANGLPLARAAFRPLSDSLIQYVNAGKVPAGTFYELYCPMVKAGWLQLEATVQNPYYGPAMLACGQINTPESGSASQPGEPMPAPPTPPNQHSHH